MCVACAWRGVGQYVIVSCGGSRCRGQRLLARFVPPMYVIKTTRGTVREQPHGYSASSQEDVVVVPVGGAVADVALALAPSTGIAASRYN